MAFGCGTLMAAEDVGDSLQTVDTSRIQQGCVYLMPVLSLSRWRDSSTTESQLKNPRLLT